MYQRLLTSNGHYEPPSPWADITLQRHFCTYIIFYQRFDEDESLASRVFYRTPLSLAALSNGSLHRLINESFRVPSSSPPAPHGLPYMAGIVSVHVSQ